MVPEESTGKRLPTLQRESLRDRSVKAIRNAITLGSIAPGTHLVETQLSEDLGVSRGTLREAMRQLQQEGLVVESSKGRLSVPELTPKLIRQTYEARAAIEAAAAMLLTKRPDFTEVVTQLDEKLEILSETETGGSLLENIDADLDFHRRICQLSKNEVLVRKWEDLAAISRMTILNAGPRYARANMAAERHRPIALAIKGADMTQIFDTLHQHTLSAVDVILGDANPQ